MVDAERDPDQELVEAARRGSKEAQSALFKRFEPLVLRYLESRMGPHLRRHSTPADLLQDVLVRGVGALQKLEEGARPEDFRGLLLRHAQWVLLERGRQSGGFAGESIVPRRDERDSNALFPDERGSVETRTRTVTRNDHNRWLRGLVSRLDQKYADVVRLYLAGRSYEEISSELGISEEAARKRFLRAMQHLRQRLEPGS